MTERGWRNTSLLLMVVVAILWWRDCARPRGAGRTAERAETPSARARSRSTHAGTSVRPGLGPGEPGDEPPDGLDDDPEDALGDGAPPVLGPDLRQQLADHWVVRFLTPHPGESMLDYRDRVVPVAQLAVAPHRTRVAASRRRFAEAAALTAEQEQALDAAVQRAADDIEDHVMQAVLSGELLPPRVRPARAVAFARDILDLLARADREFRSALGPGQLAHLDAGGFDVVDYLFFSTRWEDALGVIE
jgi:hypothetical protein